MARRVPLTALLGAGLLAVLVVLALVSDGTQTVDLQMLAGADDPMPVDVGNWRTDNSVQWCGEDPDCGYGNIALNREEAYADPSPLAIINDAYVEGKLNPYPGPKNFGPDSPISWLPEEEIDSMPGMVAEVWPDYKGSTNAAANQERSGVQLLRQVPRALEGQMRLQRAVRPELVRV